MEYLGTEKEINQILPIVSVCVQTYQHEAYIKECLDSILAQKTSFPFEIILGEDDSEDQTRKICKEYAEKNPDRIRLFLRNKKDKIFINGIKTGRFNFLENLKSCRGKYIAMCDGDDYWTDNFKLEKQINFIKTETNVSLCYSAYSYEKVDSTFFSEIVKDQIHNPEELKKTLYLGHISTWLFKNDLHFLLKNPIIYKAPVMDLVLFAYFKTQGKIASQSFNSSFYRFNPVGMYRSKSERIIYKDLIYLNYYFFRYLHKNPQEFINSGIGYFIKKYLKTFL